MMVQVLRCILAELLNHKKNILNRPDEVIVEKFFECFSDDDLRAILEIYREVSNDP